MLPQEQQHKKYPIFKSSRLHFNKTIERKLFFFLTLAMLAMGLLDKMGIW